MGVRTPGAAGRGGDHAPAGEWCAFRPQEQERWHQGYYSIWLELKGALAQVGGRPVTAPSFLDADGRTAGEQEWKALQELPSGPNALGQMVLDWARENPGDARVPEALHRVVRATRYGCSDQPYGKISKQAFDLLHGRYPESEWAKKTPYWFD